MTRDSISIKDNMFMYEEEEEEFDSEKLFEKLNRECILFPTYAKRDPENPSYWLVKVKGWALSHNSSFAKQKMMMGITKSVAGKSSIDQNCSRMFEQRFKYFLATNKRNKQFLIQSIGTTTLEDARLQLQKIQDNSQLQQAMIYPRSFYMLSQSTEDVVVSDPLLSRPTNPVSVLLDGHYRPPLDVEEEKEEYGVELKTKSSGFMSGQFVLSHDKILNWAQDQNLCEARLIQIQSICLENNGKFAPNYGVVNLVEPIGISIISDIDDTIKDTQILSGARTVLSKTFFEATQGVSGMADVYMAWYSQGASFHYVSNSPFQLMPMLDKFLRDSQFPPGSMHLRDDARLISRLVETPGQAKRESILQILHDFPQRKFVLIGDSGEIDLEIYTRIATEYPDQILKIYIRDVTTPALKDKHPNRRSSSTLSSLFHPSKRRSHSVRSSFDEDKKFRSPLGMRRAMTTTFMEYAEPHLTGHHTVRIEENECPEGLLEYHKKTISALEACAQLHERVAKARTQVSIDIVLFQDANVLENDTDIRNALWDTWDDMSNSDTLHSSWSEEEERSFTSSDSWY